MTGIDEDGIRQRLAERSQHQLLAGIDRAQGADREALLTDIASLDLEAMQRLIETAVMGKAEAVDLAHLEPANAFPSPDHGEIDGRYHESRVLGESLIAEGRVAAMVVAGGQGTRLGFDGPKGAFPVSPVRSKPLFQLFAESILETSKRYGGRIAWYVMTSPTNEEATRQFFEHHKCFGLNRDDLRFFSQGTIPSFSLDGQILLESPTRVTRSPDGHGGSLTALAAAGCLKQIAEDGAEMLSYFQVDNPLVRPVDPLFVGLHAQQAAEVSSLTVRKADDLERVGHFARLNDREVVVEYSDFPESLARAKNQNGSRRYDLANIAVHVFSREYLERLTTGDLSLPWHRAVKKVEYYDAVNDRRVVPLEPNAVKLERFVFDVLPLANRTMILERDRREVFSPVKNANGVDSVVTAQRDMSARAGRWLTKCGMTVPANCVVEISPLVANDAQTLATAEVDLSQFRDGATVYVG